MHSEIPTVRKRPAAAIASGSAKDAKGDKAKAAAAAAALEDLKETKVSEAEAAEEEEEKTAEAAASTDGRTHALKQIDALVYTSTRGPGATRQDGHGHRLSQGQGGRLLTDDSDMDSIALD